MKEFTRTFIQSVILISLGVALARVVDSSPTAAHPQIKPIKLETKIQEDRFARGDYIVGTMYVDGTPYPVIKY